MMSDLTPTQQTRTADEKLWFIAYSEGDCQESDVAEVSALFDVNDLLDTYPLPVRANSRTDAAEIAKLWASSGARDDVGDIALEHNSRTCWLEKL
jgi:hypothetical protein